MINGKSDCPCKYAGVNGTQQRPLPVSRFVLDGDESGDARKIEQYKYHEAEGNKRRIDRRSAR